ncbi:MAG: peptidoglycan-binding domain-containing protein [Cereibacter changlensis]|jgi:hypothetical protein|uniref:Antifreeze protein n=2 Tax=Cereibacter changlensis TaxID=402884 RepID=A0A2T4JV49_9RHOB|nr:peptidoglycan-binding protein [Cereibacter changlensis]MBZ4690216.1 Antifreeze protein type precursor [Cereibacter sp.]PTE21756.1 antifreeze protein [Cereibacter changlensis JA139]PZX50327.1 putative peptidoglycan binding protein [Cereibacter changlensis]
MQANLKKTGVAALVSFAMMAGAVAPAHALGKREKGFLTGVAATVAVGALINQQRNQQNQHPRRVVQQQPQYYAPQPQYYVQQPTPTYARTAPVAYEPRYRAPSIYSVPAATTFNEYSPQMRREIQLELARYGYYSGSIDGAWGPNTYRAVQAYARDSGNTSSLNSVRGAYGLYDALVG